MCLLLLLLLLAVALQGTGVIFGKAASSITNAKLSTRIRHGKGGRAGWFLRKA